jgi:hypothetical protein
MLAVYMCLVRSFTYTSIHPSIQPSISQSIPIHFHPVMFLRILSTSKLFRVEFSKKTSHSHILTRFRTHIQRKRSLSDTSAKYRVLLMTACQSNDLDQQARIQSGDQPWGSPVVRVAEGSHLGQPPAPQACNHKGRPIIM